MGLNGHSHRTPALMIIVASIRDGRAGEPVGAAIVVERVVEAVGRSPVGVAVVSVR